ncbi:MAG: putative Ig domain-containing protein [Marinilabiliaceae bacterium]|nr:putative Ig domain-containing protein [Marinilabiliaceae bacterium]
MKKNYFFTGLIAILFATTQSFAQINSGGTPPSFEFETKGLTVNAEVNLPIDFDVIELRLEDAELENAGHPPRVGKIIPANLTTNNSGEWTTLPNGTDIWRVSIIADEALAIMLTYDKFEIPDGGKLFIYNIDRSRVLGAYTEENNPKRAEYATEFIWGDHIILEYVPPTNHDFESPITISGVVYGYNHLYTVTKEGHTRIDFGGSGSCMVNVKCPEGDDWIDQRRGVTRIVTPMGSGYYLCSGTIVNNTAFDLDPLLLSAYHCFANISSLLNQTIYYFQYEHPECIGRSDPTVPTVTGATMLVNIPLHQGSDGSLLRLNEIIPESYNVYYNGWDRRDQISPNGVGIHHPRGDIMKISTYNTPSQSTGNILFDIGITATNSNWLIYYSETQNGHSVVEGGSSGSPLFDNNRRVVGTLSGGNSTCSSVFGQNIYGKLWYHWDQRTQENQKMQHYLDPINSGVEYIDGTYTVSAIPIITTTFLQDGSIDVTYNQTLTVSSLETVTWSVISGNLPDGLSISSTGIISGTPEVEGIFNFTVQATNSEGSGTKALTITITDCASINIYPYFQGFEENGASFPDCWTQEYITNLRSWTIVSNNNVGSPFEGLFMAQFKNESSSSDVTKLITPPLDLTGLGNPQLNFWLAQQNFDGEQDELRVYYKTMSADSWKLLATYTNDINAWSEKTIDLPNPSPNYYIAFEGTAKGGHGIVLDNIKIVSLFDSGNGTATDPYIITTPAQLAQLATYVNADNEDFNSKHYKLGNDLDLSDYQQGEGWIPIGTYASPDNGVFKGVFDGDNHKISGLKINTNYTSYIGLFGYVYGGTIKNLGIENADIVRNSTPTMAYAGIFAAVISNSTISNCYSTGTISAISISIRNTRVGGIVGEMNNSSISNSFSIATVNASASYYADAGGIVGYIGLNSYSFISNCYSAGAISANGNSTVSAGGVAGYIYATELLNCAALNPSIACNSSASNWYAFGRVVGRNNGTLANNTAFESMLNPTGGTTWNNIGEASLDGVNISKAQIHADGSLGSRFTTENGWITQNGKLPGLQEVVQMPEHLRLPGLPYIDTNSLPDGEVGAQYVQILVATGNTPLTWSLESGSLPPGLIFATEDATIQGIPTTAGTYNFTIKVSNNLGDDFWDYTIEINRNLYITTTSLPNGMSGVEYNQTLTSTSNTPVTWTIETGSLPTGLTLTNEGQITGTSSVSGTFVFTVKAESSWEIDTKALSITTKYIFITTGNLPAGEVGTNYYTTLNADGNEPITWELETGILPPGLNISTDGTISGLPTTAGTYKFTIKATNDLDFDSKFFPITIIKNLYITTESLPNGEANTYYSQILSATSNSPITWTVISGNLPTGITLSSDGEISGIPTNFGTFNFTVQALSSYEIETKEFTLIIINNPKIITANLPNGFVDYSYSIILEATGNTPISWTIETGNLPSGLSLSETTGIISGIPTSIGDFYFSIKATNNVGNDTQDFVIQVFTGDGSETYPYLIATAEDLVWLATVVNANHTIYNNKHYKLINDIDLSDYQSGDGWTPIGRYSSYDNNPSFKGVFDGNNKKITGLKINTTSLDAIIAVGLFGFIEGGTIKNLGVENANIVMEGTSFSSNVYAGIIAGIVETNSTISNCYSTGTVAASSDRSAYAGGIAGYIYGCTMSNCYSTASIYANSLSNPYGGAYAGGIAGVMYSNTSNCYSIGTISANSNITYAYAGGIAGSKSGTLSNCVALNPIINCTGNTKNFGRITGSNEGTLTTNIAFAEMLNTDGDVSWNNKGATNIDGADINKALINSDGTLGGRFTAENGWTTQNGKLPGLFGETVDMPEHLLFLPGAPEITSETLPVAKSNVEYNYTFTANGNQPITWTIFEDDNHYLPVGLTLSPSGVISGAATIYGIFIFYVKAENTLGSDIKEFSIEVIPNMEGDGSEPYPYIITAPDQLAWLAAVVNENNAAYNNKSYKLGNNIDLSDYQSGEGWISIGRFVNYSTNTSFFYGVFDGNNKKITGLKTTTTSISYGGLFGNVNGGTIKNLGIENAEIVVNGSFTTYAGIIAGNIGSNSTVSNCYSTGTVTAKPTGYYYQVYVGGVVGQVGTNSTVSNCYSTATVTATSSSNSNAYAGGVVGTIGSNGTLSSCYSTGTVTSNSTTHSAFAGGIVAYNHGTVSNCAALNPKINSSSNNQYIGRVLGGNSGTITSNIAFVNMLNSNGNSIWNNIGASDLDGESISKEEIYADGTFGGRFTAENGWTTQNHKLPGLFGETVAMPYHLIISGAPFITTLTLPNGLIDTNYYQTLTATGNTPIIWTHVSGNLPDGLSLSQSGIISGIPTTEGTFTFYVKAENAAGSNIKDFSIVIYNAPEPPIIITDSLSDGIVGETYSEIVEATGDEPITWTHESGNLPDGLSLSQSGIISGIPTTEGTFIFTIKAENAAGSDIKEFTIVIHNAPEQPVIITDNLSDGIVGMPYSEIFEATGDEPIIWTYESGNLPDGLSLSQSGIISGIPTTEGTFIFTIKATNVVFYDEKEFSIVIYNAHEPPIIITDNNLLDGMVGEPYSEIVEATGDEPITWTHESGNLPDGLSLSQSGIISGIPTTEGTFIFTVKAENAAGSDSKEFTIKITNLGIDGNSQQQTLTAWLQNNELHINGLIINQKWSIYNVSGVLIYEEIANKPFSNYKFQITNGIYIIRQGSRVVKVVNK